jgi:hypothetical protein
MTCETTFGLGDISGLISILTPLVLLLWFYYSQRQVHSNNYFTEVSGIYAGFTTPKVPAPHNGQMHAGIIMNIRSVDSRGFFKGDFDYAETESYTQGGQHLFGNVTDGVYSFFGDIDFELYRNKKRHPFKLKENRIYKGNLYIVDRMDFQVENYKIEDYLVADYSIEHRREMGTLTFALRKVYKPGSQKFPDKFVLYKSTGLNFEPYKNLKRIVFPQTRVDQ